MLWKVLDKTLGFPYGDEIFVVFIRHLSNDFTYSIVGIKLHGAHIWITACKICVVRDRVTSSYF